MDITDFKYYTPYLMRFDTTSGYKPSITVGVVGVKPETAKCESYAKCGDICVVSN